MSLIQQVKLNIYRNRAAATMTKKDMLSFLLKYETFLV